MFSVLGSFSLLSEASIVLDWAAVSAFFCVLFFALLQAERRAAEIRAMPANLIIFFISIILLSI